MFGAPLILIYLIGAIIGVGVLWAAKATYDSGQQDIGAKKIEEKYAPIVAVCDSLPAPKGLFTSDKVSPKDCAATMRTGLEAIGVNGQLKLDVARLADERATCTAEVARLARIGKAQETAKAARKPAVDAQVAAIDVERSELLRALGLPDPGGTCEQRLARRDAMWAKIRDQRIRDFPPSSAPAQSGDINLRAPK